MPATIPTRTAASLSLLLMAAFTPVVAETATETAAADPGATGATGAVAQPGTVLMEPVVVTATRRITPVHDLAHAAYRIDRDTLDRRQVRTLPEALADTPGVLVQKTSHGQGSPFVRGFTGYRNLALIDGVRYNNSILRDGPNEYWTLIDPLALDGIELLPSTGSVLFGSDAVGGTLQARTRSAPWRLHPDGDWFTGGQVSHRWHSSENSHISRIEWYTGQGERWGLHLGGSFKDFGDIDSPVVGRQPRTGYQQWAYDARLDLALADDWQLTLHHQLLDQDDAWRTHSTVFGRSWRGTDVGSDLRRSFDHQRTLSYARLRGEPQAAWLDAVTLTLSLQSLDETQHRVRDDGRRELSGFDLLSRGIDLQLESPTPLGSLTYGLDYYRDSVRSSRLEFDADGHLTRRGVQGPVGDGSTYDLFGSYAVLSSELTNRTRMELGGRFTYARADVARLQDPLGDGAIDFRDDWTDLSGSIRLLHDLDDDGRLRAFTGLSQSFRAPNLSDVSRLDVARSGELETAALGLSPEEFLTFEIGLRAQTTRWDAQLALFHTWIDDLIVRQPTGRVIDGLNEVTKRNAASGWVQGIELGLDHRLTDEWTLGAGLTWQQGRADAFPGADDRAVREPLSRLAPLTGTGSVRYDHRSGRWGVELAARAAARANRLSSSDRGDSQRIPPGGTPAYLLLNARSYVNLTPQWQLQINIDNLLDQDYRHHGSGSNEPGIGAALGLRWTF